MSTADTWMPLYVGDYLADTGHLSACEHGAYLLLLMHYWRNGPLPDNDKQLAAIARLDRKTWVSDVGPTIREFFVLEDGRLHQKRADRERAKWADISAKRREAGKAGAQAKHHPKPPDQPLANARQTDGKCQHEPPPPPLANASHPGGKCQDFASDLPPHLNLNQDKDLSSKEERPENLGISLPSGTDGSPARGKPNGHAAEPETPKPPRPQNAWINPNEPTDCVAEVLEPDAVGAGAVMAQVRRIAKACAAPVPIDAARSPVRQAAAVLVPQEVGAIDCDGYRYAPAEHVRTPAQQLAELLGIPVEEARLRLPEEARA